jgi:cyclophilin family peptidyl-prolyl cis-trans isomerase
MKVKTLACIVSLATAVWCGAQTPVRPAPFYTTPLTLDQMKGQQAVVNTSQGVFVIDLLPEAAPNHVGYFIKLAGEGVYAGTVFHRVIKYGIIQGGDPISKDPAKRALYGTGGLGVLRAELSAEKHLRGTVSAVIQPGKPDSAGAQWFVCVTDQPALDGKYTVFGRVSEGLDVVQKISEAPVDTDGKAAERIEIRSVTIRERPAPVPEPFSTETVEALATYRAVLETTMGTITIEFTPVKAPQHVRNFLRLAAAGVLDGTAFHRVARGFVIQAGWLASRRTPLGERQQAMVRTLAPEFNDTVHQKGTVSMAHGDDPASANTSFFICTGTTPALDGKYTAFGRVVDGMSVVEAIEAVPVDGETPRSRVDLLKVRVEKFPR